jgi:hypothetical protein
MKSDVLQMSFDEITIAVTPSRRSWAGRDRFVKDAERGYPACVRERLREDFERTS